MAFIVRTVLTLHIGVIILFYLLLFLMNQQMFTTVPSPFLLEERFFSRALQNVETLREQINVQFYEI